MKRVHIDLDGPVATVTLESEEQNRFTTPFVTEFRGALERLAADDAVRGVVVTAAQERYWCTGIHLEWLMSEAVQDPARVVNFLEALQQALLQATAFPKPLVAAINGHAIGGGAILAACFDYRIMRKDRGFVCLPAVKINIPFPPGVIALLKDILSPAAVRDMTLTGDRFTSAQAHALGFVDELVPADELLERAVALAAKLGEADLATYADTKRALRAQVLRIMHADDVPMLKKTFAQLAEA